MTGPAGPAVSCPITVSPAQTFAVPPPFDTVAVTVTLPAEIPIA